MVRASPAVPPASAGEDTEEPPTSGKKGKWRNRERVMVLCSRGASFRERHLMQDFRTLLPHSKSESKMDKNSPMHELNEICEMRNCSKCLYFECKKKKDVYLWLGNISGGPSVKFLLHNVHTMGELKMSGNCLKGSRPLLSFAPHFDSTPHLQFLKELFIQTFSTPNYHPRSQPFTDHVFNFSLTPDGKIWFRNYQIVDEEEMKLEEIGPRMVMEVICIFEESFKGAVLYQNPNYRNPNEIRREMKKAGAVKYAQRLQAQESLEIRKKDNPPVDRDPLDSVFQTRPPKRERAEDDSHTDEEINEEAQTIKKGLEKNRTRKRKRARK